ncbi:hypothetical protein BH10BDE1_BH10BDE1_01370 [soil metagenome]
MGHFFLLMELSQISMLESQNPKDTEHEEFDETEGGFDEGADDSIDETSDDAPEQASVSPSGEGKSGEPWRDKVTRMAAEVAAREGCEIYDFDFVGGGNSRALRIFIDKLSETAADGTSTNKGVSIEDCSNVSRGLNLLLDVDDVIPGGAYNLEVSSPGLERPLRTAGHFKRAAGSRAFVKTFESFAELNSALDDASRAKLGKSKQLEGTIVGVEGDDLETESGHGNAVLVFDAETGGTSIRVKLPLGKVTKANTVFIFESNEKPTGGGKPKFSDKKKKH